MYLKGAGCEAMDWISPVQDRDQWRPLVKILMSLQVSKTAEFSSAVER
jgi:hypothetical protein